MATQTTTKPTLSEIKSMTPEQVKALNDDVTRALATRMVYGLVANILVTLIVRVAMRKWLTKQ